MYFYNIKSITSNFSKTNNNYTSTELEYLRVIVNTYLVTYIYKYRAITLVWPKSLTY